IGELLVDAGVREGEVVAALAEQLGYDPVDLEKVTPEQEALYLIDPATAHALGALPLLIDDLGMVHCAVADPADTARMDTLRETVGHPVFPRLAGRLALERALDLHYTVLHKVDHAVARAVVDRQEAPAASLAIPLRADAPVVQIVDLLLTQALRDRASDVHVEPQADRLRIRCRIDGGLHDGRPVPAWTSWPAIAVRTVSWRLPSTDGRWTSGSRRWRRSGARRWCSASSIAHDRSSPSPNWDCNRQPASGCGGSSTRRTGCWWWPGPPAPGRPRPPMPRSAS